MIIYNHRCLRLLYVGSINPIQLFSKAKTWNKTFHQTWKFMTWSLLPSNHHVVSVKVQFRNGSLFNRWLLSCVKLIHFSTIVCIELSKFKILTCSFYKVINYNSFIWLRDYDQGYFIWMHVYKYNSTSNNFILSHAFNKLPTTNSKISDHQW